jgi:hypothetical protein
MFDYLQGASLNLYTRLDAQQSFRTDILHLEKLKSRNCHQTTQEEVRVRNESLILLRQRLELDLI